MRRGDIFLLLFLVILATSFFYIYQNLESLDCSIEQSISDVMSDIEYEFEPEGSSYGKTKIFRFIISSSRNRLEYFGMKVSREEGEVLFFDNRTNQEGGSILATLSLSNENETLVIDRFFKKRCYPEIHL